MMDSWILGGKKCEKYFLENFILNCTLCVTVKRKSLKILTIERRSAIKFPSRMVDVGKLLLLLLFLDIINLIPFQFFLMPLLLLLKKSVKYCCLESLRRVESKFQ